MPAGSFPSEDDAIVTIEELMRLRKDFQVSAEAVLVRLVKLAASRISCFSATRLPKHDNTAEYRIDYRIGSSLLSESATSHVRRPIRSEVLDGCVAIGTTSKGIETWEPSDPEVHMEAVVLPPLPSTNNLRIAGFMWPASEAPGVGGIEYRQGNAAVFAANVNATIVHIVNDKAQRWGPRGARELRLKHPSAYDDYAWWKSENPNTTSLGDVHMVAVGGNNRHVVTLVAPKDYGKSGRPRIRYRALDAALHDARDRLENAGVRVLKGTIEEPQGDSEQ